MGIWESPYGFRDSRRRWIAKRPWNWAITSWKLTCTRTCHCNLWMARRPGTYRPIGWRLCRAVYRPPCVRCAIRTLLMSRCHGFCCLPARHPTSEQTCWDGRPPFAFMLTRASMTWWRCCWSLALQWTCPTVKAELRCGWPRVGATSMWLSCWSKQERRPDSRIRLAGESLKYIYLKSK